MSDLRFSGHESFACRYAWLPKAFRAISDDPAAFADDESAMVQLGVGKNMVRSIRFWIDAMGVAGRGRGGSFEVSAFGSAILGEDGFDPYLEDMRTLWLLHWNLSSRREEAIFAWRYLLNHWPHAELTRTEVLLAFRRESERLGLRHSDVTLGQHLDVFLHTYVPSRHPTIAVEDSLDGPLVDLELLECVGERRSDGSGRREPVYSFRREPKSEITAALFEYCLQDYWRRWHPSEMTLSLRDAAVAPCSVGQVFKLPEEDVRTRLERYASASAVPFSYRPSAIQGLVTKRHKAGIDFLAAVYRPDTEAVHAR